MIQSEYLRHNLPCLIPTLLIFIDQEAHELRNSQNGVRIVQLNDVLVRKM